MSKWFLSLQECSFSGLTLDLILSRVTRMRQLFYSNYSFVITRLIDDFNNLTIVCFNCAVLSSQSSQICLFPKTMNHSFKVNFLSAQMVSQNQLCIQFWCLMIKTRLTYFFLVQMKFTDAMRSKARLSITGSTSENGRVPVAYLRPGLPMSLSMTDMS